VDFKKIKIVIIVEWFSEKMGYAENCLPRTLARQGYDVHVITSTAQVYFNHPDYNKIYKEFLGDNIVTPQVKMVDGYTLYRLPFKFKGEIRIKGLAKLLYRIRPDLVQTFQPVTHINYIVSLLKPVLKYRFFTGCHIHTSVFKVAQKNYWPWKKNLNITKRIIIKSVYVFLIEAFRSGKWKRCFIDLKRNIVVFSTDRIYCIAPDTLGIAVHFFSLPVVKTKLVDLGVDSSVFYNKQDEGREDLRRSLGINDSSILCIYSGRLSEDKNPLCLAKAIDKLHKAGENFHALFIGSGPQENEILACSNCKVIPFVPFPELGEYYRAADIGVWPMQESTSMLDASACGLPIIVSDKVQSPERIEGNGITYRENNAEDMADKLLYLKDPDKRKELGIKGVEKIQKRFSWDIIAANRIKDYRTFVNNNK
jgi:glycosyltransferase involved in cell wall biosynthesis